MTDNSKQDHFLDWNKVICIYNRLDYCAKNGACGNDLGLSKFGQENKDEHLGLRQNRIKMFLGRWVGGRFKSRFINWLQQSKIHSENCYTLR